jgi:hypothetical protein
MGEEKPQEPGLKLSMLVQPTLAARAVETRQLAQARQQPDLLKVTSSPTGNIRIGAAPALDRLAANLIDLYIVIPLAIAFTASSIPLSGLLISGPPTDISPLPGLIIWFAWLSVPFASMVYVCAAYGIFGNTLGKRIRGLAVSGPGPARAGRLRLLLRAVPKWGVFLALSGIWFGLVKIVFIVFGSASLTGIDGLLAALELLLPGGVLFLVSGSDLVLPSVRSDRRSLTDMLTGTRVIWRKDPEEPPG